MTSHAAQGLDAKDVYIAQSSLSFAASNEKQFYVSSSRGTERIMIYTDDKKALKEAISKSADRMSATTLLEKHKRQLLRRLRQTKYYRNKKELSYSKTHRHKYHERDIQPKVQSFRGREYSR